MMMRGSTGLIGPRSCGPTALAQAVVLAVVLAVAPTVVVAQAASGQAGCRSDTRMVPHGTRIGVLRCHNGTWVRIRG